MELESEVTDEERFRDDEGKSFVELVILVAETAAAMVTPERRSMDRSESKTEQMLW